MLNLFDHIGLEVPFTLILLAVLGLRTRVTPRTSLFIKTSPEKLWALIDVFEGKIENWGRTVVSSRLIDANKQTFEKTFKTSSPNGQERSVTALFDVSQRTPLTSIELLRGGLEGRSLNNELLKITHQLVPENGGTRLKTAYHWGPRPLLAQLTGRADLWSGAYRLKGLAETGFPNERPYYIISACVALVTGFFTLAAFGVLLGLPFALLLVVALFVHEFGHLLAFRLIGQPWGRMIFLPFLGAVAVPRMPFESQAQAVFAALMGPGFSTILVVVCAFHAVLGPVVPLVYLLGLIAAVLNLYNLIPAEPLDGGVALRSVLSNLMGSKARFGLMAIGLLVVVAGLLFGQIFMVIFGGVATVANLKTRSIDVGLQPLSSLQIYVSAFSYVAITSAHISLLRYFLEQINLLPG